VVGDGGKEGSVSRPRLPSSDFASRLCCRGGRDFRFSIEA